MAADPSAEPEQPLRPDLGLRIQRLKGMAFEGLLVGATLFGVLSLVALFVLIGTDALGPTAAEPGWYLLYLGTLVAPMSAYTLYVRRNPSAATINALSFAVAFGSLSLALVAFVVPDALGPYDVAIHAAYAFAPPLAVVAYVRSFGQNHLTGPALPVAVLVGVAAGFVLYEPTFALVGGHPKWAAYVGLVAAPAAVVLGTVAARRIGREARVPVVGIVLIGSLAVARLAPGWGVDPSLSVVLYAGWVAPTGYFVADVLGNRAEGRVGLVGPLLFGGGLALGAWLERRLGIAGLDTWLNPTLLLESWSTFQPESAGIYPQLVGSIVIVGAMAVMAFPVGVGAAIYLEEYAPSSGWGARLANALDVNISNLAGVPSVVYGLLGLALFRQVFGLSPGIVVAAGATLGLLILPIVIVSAQEALRSVPDELRRGSYGLGASRWQTVRNVVLPEAVPGILTGTILALGRAIGETAPLVMIGVATTRFSPPEGLFTGATALPLQIFAAKGNNIPEYRTGVVAAAAIVLLALMLLMNATAILIRNHYQNETRP